MPGPNTHHSSPEGLTCVFLKTRLSSFLNTQLDLLDENHYTATQTVCSICYGSSPEPPDTDPTIIKTKLCSHIFHHSCLAGWLASRGAEAYTCPMCRRELDRSSWEALPSRFIVHGLQFARERGMNAEEQHRFIPRSAEYLGSMLRAKGHSSETIRRLGEDIERAFLRGDWR